MRQTNRPLRDPLAELSRVEVLRELDSEAMAAICVRSEPLVLRKGSTVFLQGASPSLFAVLRGRVAILTRPSAEVEVQIAARHPGELLGELSPLLGQHAEEARVVELATLACLDATAFYSGIRRIETARAALARLVATRSALAHQRFGEIAAHSVRQRLLFLFRHLAAQAPVHDQRGALVIDRISQEELARMVGASRLAVSRAMQRLQREGHVSMDHRRLILPEQMPDDGRGTRDGRRRAVALGSR